MTRGRPPLDEPADKTIRVRVSAAQRLRLRRVAEQNDTDMSGVIREAVDAYCSDCRDDGPIFRGYKARSRP